MKEFPRGIDAHEDDVDPAVIGSVGRNWTDEKHESYLSFMEASFVKKLHKSRCNSKSRIFNPLSSTPFRSTSSLSAPKIHTIGSVTEVSDQNFVDTKEEPGKRLGKKRARSTVFSVTDQVRMDNLVVPLMCSGREEKNEECGKRKIFGTYEK